MRQKIDKKHKKNDKDYIENRQKITTKTAIDTEITMRAFALSMSWCFCDCAAITEHLLMVQPQIGPHLGLQSMSVW